jgi:hypothetical protein
MSKIEAIIVTALRTPDERVKDYGRNLQRILFDHGEEFAAKWIEWQTGAALLWRKML